MIAASAALSGIPTLDVFIVLGIVAAGIGGLTAIFHLFRSILRAWRKVDAFLDDWNGEEERPGVPARPGVMERLSTVEERQTTTELRLAHILGR